MLSKCAHVFMPKMQIVRRPSLGPRSCLFGIGCVIHGRVDSFTGLGQCGNRLPLLIRNRIQGVKSGFMDTEGLKLMEVIHVTHLF